MWPPEPNLCELRICSNSGKRQDYDGFIDIAGKIFYLWAWLFGPGVNPNHLPEWEVAPENHHTKFDLFPNRNLSYDPLISDFRLNIQLISERLPPDVLTVITRPTPQFEWVYRKVYGKEYMPTGWFYFFGYKLWVLRRDTLVDLESITGLDTSKLDLPGWVIDPYQKSEDYLMFGGYKLNIIRLEPSDPDSLD